MAFFDNFRKKQAPPEPVLQNSTVDYINSLLSGGFNDGIFVDPYSLYKISADLGNAVDRISSAFAGLNPVVRNKKDGTMAKFADDNPVLAIFDNLRSGLTKEEFFSGLMTSYLLTGAAYPIALGNPSRPPVGLTYVQGSAVARHIEGLRIAKLTTMAENNQDEYSRDPSSMNVSVYVNRASLASITEVAAARVGFTPVSPVKRIIEQITITNDAYRSNAQVLKRGSRPNAIWSPKDEAMNQNVFNQFKEQIRLVGTGLGNAGNDIIAPIPIDYNLLWASPKDMDFLNMINTSKESVYTQFDIPLPLVSTGSMTLSNYENSILAFYDLAVIPRAKLLLSQLGRFLFDRFEMPFGAFELTIDERDITAIKSRLLLQQEKMTMMGTYSVNEIRAAGGAESIGVEGDMILIDSNKVPLAEDKDTRVL